jgi:DNA-binding NarL/FixJ family response regulator
MRASVQELEFALRTVVHGGRFIGPRLAGVVVARLHPPPGGSRNGAAHSHVTPRQLEIIRLIAEGATSREIAQSLRLSFKTVTRHRADIMARLNVHDVAGLVRWAIRAGVLSPELAERDSR